MAKCMTSRWIHWCECDITSSPPSLQRIPQFPEDNRTIQAFCKCDDFMLGLMQVCDPNTLIHS